MADMRTMIRSSDYPKPFFYPNKQTLITKPVRSRCSKICKFWVNGRCIHGDNCKFYHSWFRFGRGFRLMARLQGHNRPVAGIAHPFGSHHLYTASRDGTVRVSDCHSGRCDRVIDLGAEIGCLICEGSWVFIGLPNSVRVWKLSDDFDVSTMKEFSLDGPLGQVYALAVHKGLLFAGSSNGDILVWKGSFEANPFKLLATLKGHKKPIVCLDVGSAANCLYSGSMDNSVKVWDLDSLQCKQTLDAHSDVVMSLLSWDRSLLTCSLDRTMKLWVIKDEAKGVFELVKTHEHKSGILKVFGMSDAQGMPTILCSCNDNCVRVYEFYEPGTLIEKDTIFAEEEVRVIQGITPYGLFFTGDATGVVSVWNWVANETEIVSATKLHL